MYTFSKRSSLIVLEQDIPIILYIQKILSKKRKYTQFSARDRLLVGKHASIFGNASAVRKFHVSESTIRLFRRKYESSLTNVHLCEKVTEISQTSLGRSLMNGKLLDKQVQEYLYIYRKKVIWSTKVVTVATAKTLIKRNNLEHLKDLDLEDSSWVKSLFKRMGFVDFIKQLIQLRKTIFHPD